MVPPTVDGWRRSPKELNGISEERGARESRQCGRRLQLNSIRRQSRTGPTHQRLSEQ